jgi:hypothetical protein
VQRQGSIGGSAEFRIRVTGGVLLVAHLAFVAWFTLRPLNVPWAMVSGRLVVSPLASLLRTVTAGALLSLGIELLQTGVPGQVVDVDSLFLNTAGVALAHLALVPAGRSWLRRRTLVRLTGAPLPPEEPAQGRTPTIPRVGIAPWSDALPPSSP